MHTRASLDVDQFPRELLLVTCQKFLSRLVALHLNGSTLSTIYLHTVCVQLKDLNQLKHNVRMLGHPGVIGVGMNI